MWGCDLVRVWGGVERMRACLWCEDVNLIGRVDVMCAV